MTGRWLHIVLLMAAFLFTGCVREGMPSVEEPGIKLTVKCGETFQSKADTREGEKDFNENLIKSVDFLFYPGTSPAADADAVFHIRKVLEQDPMESAPWETTFNLVIKKDVIELIFTEANDNKAFVYALVNCEESLLEDLSQTSREDIAARRIVTDFAAGETSYVYPQFLMDGGAAVQYDPDAVPNVDAVIDVRRFASKLTLGVNVASSVVLKHQDAANHPDETWEPVLHTMRVYLVDGRKSVLLSSEGTDNTQPEYFSYRNDANKRPYVREDSTPFLPTESVGGKDYLTTWPMYSYPCEWSGSMADYANENYAEHDNNLPPEPPYFKLEMDWRRLKDANYDYDRRKYYYKIFMPFNALKRNSWYGFYVDVSILGAETDEGKALLEPTCYLLDWQNKSLAINKSAVISKARYLSVDKTYWEINNMDELSIPFLSSHNVKVVSGSVTATRPFFGEIGKNGYVLGDYNTKLHAYIRGNSDDGYYLDYTGQPEGSEKWEPASWLTNTSTSINLNHPLVNNNTKDDFDYSAYTIDFDIVHTDLEEGSHTYSQYLRHITIVQYPGIYIERLRNSDTQIQKRVNDGKDQGLYGYPDGEEPWKDKPWGYVYVNGGRFIRHETTSHTGSEDAYFSLHSSNRKEYQWQTVWYTGGSRDIYDIHVTVLPSTSSFVIGDPRLNTINNLDDASGYPGLYEFTVGGNNRATKWHDVLILEGIRSGTQYPEVSNETWRRTGFNEADALYGEPWRSLQWYYPTENSSRTENMVAPSYRISSKFSGIEFGNIDKKYAEYRCAAFQEDGFPAGRWRLPTKAEINFIGQLSAKGFFEFLFNNNGVYWSANGAVKVSNGSVDYVNSETALLRCVYDSWYWDEVDGLEGDPRHNPRDRFVWGDKER